MLAKFFRESALVQAFTDTRSGPERLAASPWARATTPDQIIVAHILQDYVKNPSNWQEAGILPDTLSEKKTSTGHNAEGYRRGDKTTWFRTGLVNFRLTDGKATVNLVTFVRNQDGDGLAPWVEKSSFEVNRVQLADDASAHLFKNLQTLIVQKKAAAEVAAKAQAELEENEKKWNLAETLLGMKRNEYGALVPTE